jgi:pimeloyl-ACP methyl ester carboxylesterase
MPSIAGLFYEYHPPKPASSRPPILLIHGAGGSRLSWTPGQRRLPGQAVYALDLPGHGNSNDTGVDSIAGYARAISAWLEALSLTHVVLTGHSMGSAIVLQLAAEAPEKVCGLALLGSSARLRVNPVLLESIGNPVTFPQAIKKIIHWSFAPQSSERLKLLAAQRMAICSPQALWRDFQACNDFDITGRLAEIRQSTLVISGELDKMTPASEGEALARALPQAQFTLIPAAGHMVMLEQPEETARLLAQFLIKSIG